MAFSSNWLLLLVSQRKPETSQQLMPSLVAEEVSTLNTLIPRLLGSAKVEVDPQYGTWNTKGTLARVEANRTTGRRRAQRGRQRRAESLRLARGQVATPFALISTSDER